ncbi:MAG TPA: hypothetical protein VGR90_00235 [Acidimicrobiales bacterium]|nr:hypothetical protein [Acidimicrobiales bacterium]
MPLVGFSWGFDIDDGRAVTLHPVAELSPNEWNSHLETLRQTNSDWEFPETATFGA